MTAESCEWTTAETTSRTTRPMSGLPMRRYAIQDVDPQRGGRRFDRDHLGLPGERIPEGGDPAESGPQISGGRETSR
jgi:uncharacterized protein (DUF2141 family)